MRENFNIDLQPATYNLQLAVYRDMQYEIRNTMVSKEVRVPHSLACVNP